MSRPTALKKDNIQTRNRKLSQKSKKKRHSGFGGFLPGVDTRFTGYSGGMVGGMMGSGGMHHLPSHMSGYYPELHASMTSQVNTKYKPVLHWILYCDPSTKIRGYFLLSSLTRELISVHVFLLDVWWSQQSSPEPVSPLHPRPVLLIPPMMSPHQPSMWATSCNIEEKCFFTQNSRLSLFCQFHEWDIFPHLDTFRSK